MDNTYLLLLTVIKCLAAVVIGIIEGNGAVYLFNRLPAAWLTEYGEEPAPELKDRDTQRLKSMPWKYLFSIGFVILNIRLVMDDPQFALGASLAVFLLLLLAVSDRKYRILPDQLILLLAVTSLGFLPYHSGLKEVLLGGAVGFGITGGLALIGYLAYHRDTLGGGDVKLFTALGLICGPWGVLFVFVASTLLAAAHFVALMARGKLRATDSKPLAPYIAVSAAAYLVFFWDLADHLLL
ncbi:MAG: prepilin peptidase [Firmicutes bacterium]|nr:prepilin peptidase [Bacillota bacterium]